ncbi:MAG: FAD-binding oxidoreductase, partial [Thermoplasmata archaeon]|nr:FAD-binding oxidoreductase [Thermoplasmata archaeon]
MTLDPNALRALRDLLGDRLRTEPPELEPYRRDASHLVGSADAVARPDGAEEVAMLVRWARAHRVPLVARGAGTSLDGEAVPGSGVVVDLSGWTRILEIDPVDRIARVQPGVVNHDLQLAVASAGLFFPPNPGSWRSSTIGGNVSTNASGPRSFRYGPTRAWVRAAEAVLGTSERVHLGTRARKRSLGPDLLQLLVGSEGTLGILTEITVELSPTPERRAGLGVAVSEGLPLGPLVSGLSRSLADGLAAVEYLDRRCADALARTPGARLPAGRPLLLLEVESPNEAEESDRLERLHAHLVSLGVTDDPVLFPDANRLWSLRGESSVALDREMGERIREDVSIPLSRLDEFLEILGRIGRERSVATCVY